MKPEPQLTTAPQHVALAVAAARDHKADDLRLLDLSEVSDFTDYFLICSGHSDRQVRAIAEAVDEQLRGTGSRALHVEGLREGKWVLLDYGDLVVHVFDEERRRFYRLDRLWADASAVLEDRVQASAARRSLRRTGESPE